jgi:hypothetical protein
MAFPSICERSSFGKVAMLRSCWGFVNAEAAGAALPGRDWLCLGLFSDLAVPPIPL